MLSYQRIGWKQRKQCEPGQRMLFSKGSRAAQALRKLPTAAPNRKTKASQTQRNSEGMAQLPPGGVKDRAASTSAATSSGDRPAEATTRSAHPSYSGARRRSTSSISSRAEAAPAVRAGRRAPAEGAAGRARRRGPAAGLRYT